MKRSEQREQAFSILFEQTFGDVPFDELADNALLARDLEICDYAEKVVKGVEAHREEIDAEIETRAIGWQKKRISKVALAILRLAVYEMRYEEEVPVAVSANEAVELAKKYATKEDASFVNGILGTVARAGSAGRTAPEEEP